MWSNPNFRYIFMHLFHFSIDMPISVWPVFEQFEMVNHAKFSGKKNAKILNGEFFDFDRWTFKARYEDLYEPLFLDAIFDKGANRINKEDFVEKLSYHKF